MFARARETEKSAMKEESPSSRALSPRSTTFADKTSTSIRGSSERVRSWKFKMRAVARGFRRRAAQLALTRRHIETGKFPVGH